MLATIIIKRQYLAIKPRYLMEMVTVCKVGSVQKPIPVGSKVESTNKYGTVPTTEQLSSETYILPSPVLRGNIQPRFDYLGYILYCLGHQKLQTKDDKYLKLPSQGNILVPPFTQQVRGVVVETDLSVQILRLTLSPESERTLAALLAPWYNIQFED